MSPTGSTDLLAVRAVAIVDHQGRLRDLVAQRAALAAAGERKCDHGRFLLAGHLPSARRPLKRRHSAVYGAAALW
jgi:hypothetical protein